MEEKFFDAMSFEEQERARKAVDALLAPRPITGDPLPFAESIAPMQFAESRRERRIRERAEAKRERKAKA